MQYFGIIDGHDGAFALTFPDAPGCFANGQTVEGVIDNAVQSLRDWIGAKRELGIEIPEPRTEDQLMSDTHIKAEIASGAVIAPVPLSAKLDVPPRARRR